MLSNEAVRHTLRICLFLGLLSLVDHAVARDFPTSEQVRAWAGFPSGLHLDVSPEAAGNERASGSFVAGRRYASDSTRYSYSVKLFAPDSFLHGRREELLVWLKKLREIDLKSGPMAECGLRQTSKGRPVYIFPGGLGPGGGSIIAFASMKRFDLVVEEYISDEGHPLDKTHEQGPLPSNSLLQFFGAALDFFSKREAGSP